MLSVWILINEARRIATAVRDAGGRALCVGGFVRDRLLGSRRPKTSTSRSSASRRSSCCALLQTLGRVEPVGQAFPGLQARRHRRGAAAARIEDRPRPQGLHRRRRSVDAVRRGGATARLHDQRDRLGSAHRRVSRSVQRPRRISSSVSSASSIRRTFADDSLRVLRALQFAARFELTHRSGHGAHLRVDRARRSAGRAHLGRVREAAAAGASGRRSASRSRASSA